MRYTDKIQQAYPQYQVINAGINGFSTVQASLLLEKYWQPFSPHLVVLQVFHNDFAENLEEEAAYAKPYLDWNQQFVLRNHPVADSAGLWMSALLWVGDNTYFYRQLIVRAYPVLVNMGVNWSQEKRKPPQDPAILEQGMVVALNRLIDFCQQHRVPLMMISSNLEPYQQATVQRVAEQHRVPYYDLSQRVFVGQKDFDLRDHAGHWNAYGHQLVADFTGSLVNEQLHQQLQNQTSGAR